jgi:membrane-bound lytic murein transglycosylase B
LNFISFRFLVFALIACVSATGYASEKQKNKKRAKPSVIALEKYSKNPTAMQAADGIAERMGVRPQWVRHMIGQAHKLPGVIQAMTPSAPTTVKDWGQYRDRVMVPARIESGVRFWSRNADTLARAERETGVSASTIVGILGVETQYGQNMGRYRTIDALTTLAFDFPQTHPKARTRAAYFLQELEAFLVLTKASGRDPMSVRGSYAGAMGMAQFMPSSWLKYAVDFDGDGRIDLFQSSADAIGSIAHYLRAFHWKPGMPTHYPVALDAQRLDLAGLLASDILPSMTPEAMSTKGAVLADPALRHAGLLALIELPNGRFAPAQYVVGTDNFYAITRYNWSSFYAMSVIDLGQAVQSSMPIH